MSRYIVILTLALTASLSSSKAPAQQANAVPVLVTLVINTNVVSMELVDAGMVNQTGDFDELGISESLRAQIRSFALTAAPSESETYAQANQVPLLALSVIQTAEAPLEEIAGMLHFSIRNEGGSDLHSCNEVKIDPENYVSALRAVSQLASGDSGGAVILSNEIDGLIAIIAFETDRKPMIKHPTDAYSFGQSTNGFCGDDDLWVFIAECF